MMFFDLKYFIFVGPFILLSMWAAYKVRSAFSNWSKYRNSRGMSGADVARAILQNSGCSDVRVERVAGQLTDHYDPSSRTLRLSDSTFDSNSVAAAGVAAHEAGHAIQHKVSYPLLGFRSAVVGFASIGSRFGALLVMAGFLLMMFLQAGVVGYFVAWAGVLLFTGVVVFQLATVPVEINASSRAKKILVDMGMVSSAKEMEGVDDVLNAAAWTYVAAALTSLAQLAYFIFMLLGMRRDD